MNINNNKRIANNLGNTDIIQAILSSKIGDLRICLSDDPRSINDLHEESGMNAAMLAAFGRLSTLLEEILRHANYLNFSHTSYDGYDLLDIAIASMDNDILALVQTAYRTHRARNPSGPTIP